MLEDRYKKQILDICSKRLGANYELYLFGSRARGDDNPASDIDLAVKLPRDTLHGAVLLTLAEDFEASTIPFKIDFLDIDNISKEIKNSILSEGILLHG